MSPKNADRMENGSLCQILKCHQRLAILKDIFYGRMEDVHFFGPEKKNNQHNTDVRCCAVKTNTTPEFTFVDVGCKQSSKKSGKSGGDDTKT